MHQGAGRPTSTTHRRKKGASTVMGFQVKSLLVGAVAGYVIAVYLPKFMSR